jgi:fructose-specific phosphotransferase system IIC component
MEIEQTAEEGTNYEEEISEESLQQENSTQQEPEQCESVAEQTDKLGQKHPRQKGEGRSSFIHGLAVGLGIGCITTFVILWITVFFSPLLPQTVTYEGLLAIFIYPLVYLLAVGLVALTAGIVREYYAKTKF